MVFCDAIDDDEDPFQPVTSDETVAEGGTVTLTCRVAETDNSSLQWSNTAQQTLYFGAKRGKTHRDWWVERNAWMDEWSDKWKNGWVNIRTNGWVYDFNPQRNCGGQKYPN